MNDIIVRASQLHKIMGDSRSGNMLSETAETYAYQLIKNALFGEPPQIMTPEIQKGNEMEALAIKASGRIRGEGDYTKNTQRLTNGLLTGEPDIMLDDKLIDIKNCWSIDTWPMCQRDASKKTQKAGYYWQMQGYMWLFDKEQAEIDYWLLPTPEHLLKMHEKERHINQVNQVPIRNRCTTVLIDRDEKAIEKMKIKLELFYEFIRQNRI